MAKSCHGDMAEGKFRHAVSKMKEKGSGKTGWSTGMMNFMNLSSQFGPVKNASMAIVKIAHAQIVHVRIAVAANFNVISSDMLISMMPTCSAE